MEAAVKKRMSPCVVVRMVLLIIVLLTGLFWTWFGVASGIFEGLGFVGTVMHSLVPGVLLILLCLLAMKWPVLGGLLLLIAGTYSYLFFHVHDWRVFAALVSPPIVAGLWAIISAITCRPKRVPAPKGNQ